MPKKIKYYLGGIFGNIIALFLIFLLIISISHFSLDNSEVVSSIPVDADLPPWTVSVLSINNSLTKQVNAGYRIPGSNASEQVRTLIRSLSNPFQVTFQNFTYKETNISNVIVKINAKINTTNQIILGAHYDTRAKATSEPSDNPVPGANDGASGVSGLLSIIEWFKNNNNWEKLNTNLVFVFFDAEDQGGINGWDWIVGSTYFANSLSTEEVNNTVAFVLLDMVGDIHLNLKKEHFSTPFLNDEFWSIAWELGFSDYFSSENGYWLIDDHRPFLGRGIPSIDLIDFDYSEWHKTTDDLNHVSPFSIAIVSDVVLYWLGLKAGFIDLLKQSSLSTTPPTTSSFNVSNLNNTPNHESLSYSSTKTKFLSSFSFLYSLITTCLLIAVLEKRKK